MRVVTFSGSKNRCLKPIKELHFSGQLAMVKLLVDSDLCSVVKDIPQDASMAFLCDRIYPLTGVAPEDMQLTIEDQQGKILKSVKPLTAINSFPLKEYSGVSRIVVVDTNASSMANQLRQSDADVDAFTLSEADYAQRNDSVMAWKARNKLGRFDPEYQQRLNADRAVQESKLRSLQVGERCSVQSSDQPERRGWLRFVGKVPEISATEVWCGVQFDEPAGRNDGSFKGVVYFGPVGPNYGGFVKPSNVTTGPNFVPLEAEFEWDDQEV